MQNSAEIPHSEMEPGGQRDPHEILGIGYGANAMEVEVAYKQRAKDLQREKTLGQKGEGRLVAENEFEDLKAARDTLINRMEAEAEIDTDELDPSLIKRDAQEVWDKFSQEPLADQLKSIIAYLLYENTDKREQVSRSDIEKFYKEYPLGDNELKTRLNHLVEDTGKIYGPAKEDKYRKAADRFLHLMYPEQN